MSEVNRMLLQLDARTPAPSPQPALAGATHGGPSAALPAVGAVGAAAKASASARWRLPLIVLAGGSAIAAAALADLSALQPKAAKAAAVAISDAAAVAPTADVERAPTAAPAAAVAVAVAAEATATPVAAAITSSAPVAVAVAAPTPAPTPAPTSTPSFATPPAAAVAAQPSPPTLALPQPTFPLPRIDKRTLPSSSAERAALAHREAVDLARLGQNQAALQRAMQALSHDPTHSAARQLAAVLQHENGNSPQALALLREGAALPAAPPALTLLLARLLAAQGLQAEALQVLDAHQLRSAEAQGLRAGLLAQQGQYGLALPAYESAVQQEPANAMWWLGLAVALESEGQAARARQAFVQARQLRLPTEDLAAYAEERVRALP